MATRQYIGARYVPKFYTNSVDGSTAWESNVVYEPLTYVTLANGHMYISKKQVPATVGTPASNIDYWLDIGSYNGFIEDLQNQINTINNETIPAIESVIVKHTNTVATMIASDFSVGDVVCTTGYFNQNDGGGAFYIISSTSEGLYETLNNGLYAILVVESYVDSKWVGMMPMAYDAVADQTALLDKLINYSSANNIPIYFDSGHYFVKEVNLIEKNKCQLIGVPKSREHETVFSAAGTPTNSSNAFVITEELNSTTYQRDIVLENITFYENGKNINYGCLIKHAIFSSFKHIQVIGFEEAFVLISNWNMVIDDIYLNNFRKYGYEQKVLVNNLEASNIHCTNSGNVTPLANFKIEAANAVSLINPTSEGNITTHFAVDNNIGLTIISPHCESGDTFIDIVGGMSSITGAITVIGGIWQPDVTLINTSNKKFVESSSGKGLHKLVLLGLRMYTDDGTNFVHDDYLSFPYVQTLWHEISFVPTAITGDKKTRIKKVGYNLATGYYRAAEYGISSVIKGNNDRIHSGSPYKYSFRSYINGTNFANGAYVDLEYLLDDETPSDGRLCITVKAFQNYNSGAFAGEGQYAEYRVMIANNGALTSQLVAGGTEYTLSFTYTNGVLAVTASEAYGNYIFECEVLTATVHV